MQKSALSHPPLSFKTVFSAFATAFIQNFLWKPFIWKYFLKVTGHLLLCSQEFFSRCQKLLCFNYTVLWKAFHTMNSFVLWKSFYWQNIWLTKGIWLYAYCNMNYYNTVYSWALKTIFRQLWFWWLKLKPLRVFYSFFKGRGGEFLIPDAIFVKPAVRRSGICTRTIYAFLSSLMETHTNWEKIVTCYLIHKLR